MWRFLKKRHVIKEGDFSPRHKTFLMRLVMKAHKLLSNFTALLQQQTQETSVFTVKATYQWDLHGLVIQVVL
jgi:hypothetical protein